ncbi:MULTISPECIES: MepB family protein [Chryseobacterium]|uniref:MepB family protein n=1 Tax=Chryseobacterium aquaticum TaxID=452084 RepID=A0A0Q3K6Z9_9FLAO|nr:MULTISPECIES: MepB family protein [Chryseobacterium]KNB60677.1 hypothetical protein AC804_16030 [Chryseobacterium sp. Hurlbut01]KQK25435.1 hypothetical protein AR438_07425 [Chryseobacterium aquaticum]
MIRDLQHLQTSVFSKLHLIISQLQQDSECEEYLGYNFQISHFNIKFRKAKITPKKIGQFVTLWKRNPESRQTEPFHHEDLFDFYIIACDCAEKSGFFLFPKNILSHRHILTTLSKEGKRGFRVYPDWDFPENKQAKKTQDWQKEFFIDFSDENYLKKFVSIFNFSLQ